MTVILNEIILTKGNKVDALSSIHRLGILFTNLKVALVIDDLRDLRGNSRDLNHLQKFIEETYPN